MTSLEWSNHMHTLGLVYMEDIYVHPEVPSCLITDIIQPPETLEAIANTSAQMLESNGHFLHIKMMAEQQATKIVQLQEALNVQAKENNNLKVQNKTLKYIQPFPFLSTYIHYLRCAVTPWPCLQMNIMREAVPPATFFPVSELASSLTSQYCDNMPTSPSLILG
jgi:hypothetical protein